MLSSAPSTGSEAAPNDEKPFLVCVHVGAGSHPKEKIGSLRRLMNHACRAAAQELAKSGNLDEAVTCAISVLEDSEITNAGYGSNLNFEGEVECDASIMTGRGCFGAIGAASGIKNPIKAANLVAKLSSSPLSHARVRPIFLAGDGARKLALQHGLDCEKDGAKSGLMNSTEDALRNWRHYRSLLSKSLSSADSVCPAASGIKDTVGCIVVNSAGEVCAGVSSGGVALKVPGRVGEAAIYGAGCWAKNAQSRGDCSIACSVSGVGEVVTRGLIAKSCADCLTKDTPLDSIKDVVELNTSELGDPTDIGVLAVRSTTATRKGRREKHVELCVVHNTESMGFAYLTANSKTLSCFLKHDHDNESIAEFGACIKWPIGEIT